MGRDDDIIRIARILMSMEVLGGPATMALGVAVAKYAPKLIEKAVNLTRYPIVFQGYIVNYGDPCGYCRISGYVMYRLLYFPLLAYCPGCRAIHPVDNDDTPPSGGILLAY